MSSRRKKYSRSANSRKESDGTSESDTPSCNTDHQRTMQIITRLSQKYLKTRITPAESSQESSQESPTTDTEREYYGDEENSPDTGVSDASMASTKDYDAFDFSRNEDPEPILVLSPVKTSNLNKHKQPKPRKKTASQKKSTRQTVKISPQTSNINVDLMLKSRTRAGVSQKSVAVNKSTSIQETPCQRQLRKRKSTATSDTASSTSVDTTWGVHRSSPRIKTKRDSGIFISPPVQKRAKLGKGQATSTPNTDNRTQIISMDDSQYGFGAMESPVIDISPVPVKQTLTPMSDYCSMSSTPFTSMDISSVDKPPVQPTSQGFPFVLQEEIPESTKMDKVHKSKSRRPKKVPEKDLQWAEKMNKEFEELENFELSIEG